MAFLEKFKDFCKRPFCVTDDMTYEQFTAIVKNGRIICKPIGGEQGRGIEVFDVSNENCEQIFSQVSALKGYIAEEWIIQHDYMSKLYPDAINPIRVQTLVRDGEVTVAGATITLGNGKKYANASANALFALIDVKTGCVYTHGCDYNMTVYECHPTTKARFKDIRVPYWNEIISLTKQAALVTPSVTTIGWDVAVTESGPVIIEGNIGPGYTGMQLPLLSGKHIGNLEVFKPFLN